MTRLGIEQIVHNHRIPLCTLDLDTQSTQEEDIELHILSHLRNALALEDRAQNRGILRLDVIARAHIGIVTEWHIPRLVLTHRKRESHNAVAKHIESRGLDIEAEEWRSSHLCHHLTQFVCRIDGCICVWHSSHIGKSVGKEVVLHLLTAHLRSLLRWNWGKHRIE